MRLGLNCDAAISQKRGDMKNREHDAVNIQLLEVTDEPYTITNTYESSFYQRVTFKMLDKEKRRRVTACVVYSAILLLGILIGLIPYLLHFVKESRGKILTYNVALALDVEAQSFMEYIINVFCHEEFSCFSQWT